jgi:hypothetical protein
MTEKITKKGLLEVKEGEDPIIFSKNYTNYCKLVLFDINIHLI